MAESGWYPEGTEFNDSSPWNEKPVKKIFVDTNISVTLSKKISVSVPENYDQEDIEEWVNSNVVLPQERCEDWTLDEYVITED